ncbi:hypothetical protein PAXRUDRAFT_15346 [Paxillus rubicundulus Ve08.2h10]|uniref:Uncharacterized protein n=1 Tax=Paxillus rubicundulus Ve08.2h10 TaxID=930991 RepID=A0A0D0CZU3_9AGAM|nr:hypothetical protein PAXRUDRAFT_15346 [Paxillus rubicundulus Ve08.2h10]
MATLGIDSAGMNGPGISTISFGYLLSGLAAEAYLLLALLYQDIDYQLWCIGISTIGFVV